MTLYWWSIQRILLNVLLLKSLFSLIFILPREDNNSELNIIFLSPFDIGGPKSDIDSIRTFTSLCNSYVVHGLGQKINPSTMFWNIYSTINLLPSFFLSICISVYVLASKTRQSLSSKLTWTVTNTRYIWISIISRVFLWTTPYDFYCKSFIVIVWISLCRFFSVAVPSCQIYFF